MRGWVSVERILSQFSTAGKRTSAQESALVSDFLRTSAQALGFFAESSETTFRALLPQVGTATA